VVAEYCGIRYFAFDERFCEFEDSGLRVRRLIAIGLVAGKNRKVGFLVVQDPRNEIQSPGISFAASFGRGWFNIATFSDASGQV
jgi:hypothetical protein